MDARDRLSSNLEAESKAYGFTLTIWGAGALLIHAYGAPRPVLVFAYVTGALLAFAVLTAATFRSLFGDVERDVDGQMVAVSMVHIGATFGNLALTSLLIAIADAVGAPVSVTFLAVGFQTTVVYNLLLLLEDIVLERVAAAVVP